MMDGKVLDEAIMHACIRVQQKGRQNPETVVSHTVTVLDGDRGRWECRAEVQYVVEKL